MVGSAKFKAVSKQWEPGFSNISRSRPVANPVSWPSRSSWTCDHSLRARLPMADSALAWGWDWVGRGSPIAHFASAKEWPNYTCSGGIGFEPKS